MERTALLTALYGTTLKSELLKQFDRKLSTVNTEDEVSKRYTHLLEQVLYFSHAIIYGQESVNTIQHYRRDFMLKAKNNKTLNLSSSKVEYAFSFFNRTVKKELEKTTTPSQPIQISEGCAIAKKEIKRLKKELDTKSYKLARGQKVEDKETFMKIAIVAMATGARLQDIMEDLPITDIRGKKYFDSITLLVIDFETVQTYIKAIRKHYKASIAKNKKAVKKYSNHTATTKEEKKELRRLRESESVDISTGVRKAIKRLNINGCSNLNHLNQLYKDCIK